MQKKKILVVDDEKQIVETLKAYLEKDQFDVIVAYDGEEALEVFQKERPDFVVLDLMLPKITGEEVCLTIRESSNVPIIMLSAKINEDSKLNGFVLGADDYVTKPFSPKEIVARIHSILKRVEEKTGSLIFNDDLKIDFEGYTVYKKDVPVNLTASEFKILSILVQNPSHTYSREELITLAFQDVYTGFDRTIDSHIKNLRAKIEDDENKYIITVRGFGYKFDNRKVGMRNED